MEVVNSEFDSFSSSAIESLKVQKLETKENHEVLFKKSMEKRSSIKDSMGESGQEISRLKREKLSKKLNNHEEEVGSQSDNVQAEIVNI
jgi:hypothetical protein